MHSMSGICQEWVIDISEQLVSTFTPVRLKGLEMFDGLDIDVNNLLPGRIREVAVSIDFEQEAEKKICPRPSSSHRIRWVDEGEKYPTQKWVEKKKGERGPNRVERFETRCNVAISACKASFIGIIPASTYSHTHRPCTQAPHLHARSARLPSDSGSTAPLTKTTASDPSQGGVLVTDSARCIGSSASLETLSRCHTTRPRDLGIFRYASLSQSSQKRKLDRRRACSLFEYPFIETLQDIFIAAAQNSPGYGIRVIIFSCQGHLRPERSSKSCIGGSESQ
ncbi:hypothetical protein B0H11DRAFT_2200291, partial [Mycena galericulata]